VSDLSSPSRSEGELPELELSLKKLEERGVYLLFDPRLYPDDWEYRVCALYEVGIPWFQLRSKGARDEEILEWAGRFRRLLPEAVLIINDRPDLALKAGAHGVHVGPEDLPPSVARKILGPRAIVGSSGDDPRRLNGETAEGVTYFGVGTFRFSPTKPDAGDPLGWEGLKRAQALNPLPKVAVGGVLPEDLPAIRRLRYIGVAVCRGIWFNNDFLPSARRYLDAWRSSDPSPCPDHSG
jgi:thiamine-phosphate pyrophosphorylase